MKLGPLNAAIDAAGEVCGNTRLGLIAFKKGSLKAALRRTYGADRSARTGFRLEERATPEGPVSVVVVDPDD